LDDEDRPFTVLSEIDQDPRAFIASICYTGRGEGILKPHENEDAKWAKVFTLDEIAELLKQKDKFAFRHHMKILEKYLREKGY
jgi:ADP-ribose pyrophosphatase YjhB (NUDIX family)